MNRNTIRIWASADGAAVTDPNLDINHPGGNGGNNKYEHGWIVEKEPHQWANFIYKNVDVSIEDLLKNGTLVWESTPTYHYNCICIYNSVMYRALVSNANKVPSSNPTYWEVIPYGTSTDFANYINTVSSGLVAHMAIVGPTDNAHNTTAAQADTYTITESGAKIKVVQDDLDLHESQSNPHNLDAIDVGCLGAVAGGHFTGTVLYSLVGFKQAGSYIDADGIINTSDSLSIVNNIPYQKTSEQEIVTDTSYTRINRKYGHMFALPPVDIAIPFSESLNSPSSGNFTLSYGRPTTYQYVNRAGATVTAAINEPPFGQFGLYLTADTVLTFSGLMAGTTSTVYYVLNDKVIIKDVSVNSDNLIDYIGTSGQVRDIRIWIIPLTDYQESMLGG